MARMQKQTKAKKPVKKMGIKSKDDQKGFWNGKKAKRPAGRKR